MKQTTKNQQKAKKNQWKTKTNVFFHMFFDVFLCFDPRPGEDAESDPRALAVAVPVGHQDDS